MNGSPETAQLDFRHQTRLLYVGEFNFDSRSSVRAHFLARLLAGHAQIQSQSTVRETFEAAFKMPVVVDRLPRRQLHAATDETRKICRFRQLAIQPRRRNFQRVRPAWNYVLDVEDRAKFAAEVGAIFVRHAWRLTRRRPGLIEEHAQHPRAASTQKLDIDHFEAAGGGYALCNLPDPFDGKRHECIELQAMASDPQSLQRKSGLAPTGVLRQMPVHSSSSSLIYAGVREKDKPTHMPRGKARGEAQSLNSIILDCAGEQLLQLAIKRVRQFLLLQHAIGIDRKSLRNFLFHAGGGYPHS